MLEPWIQIAAFAVVAGVFSDEKSQQYCCDTAW